MNTAHPDSNRTCGRCHSCCVHIAIPVLNKPLGVPCQHLVKGPGCCGIYENRPSPCAAYKCAWLDGFFARGMRPDKSGLLLEFGWIEWPRKLILLSGCETRPGALDLAEHRLSSALPEGCVAVIENFERTDAAVLGRDDDLEAFRVFMANCQANGGLTRRTPDGDAFVEIGARGLVQLETSTQGGTP